MNINYTENKEPQFIVATINGRIQPLDRGKIYEDPLDEILRQRSLGEISGGGTLQSKTGEIEYCDIEIQIINSDDETIAIIKETLEKIGAPVGSKIKIESTGSVIKFGTLEGLAIYLNGTDLDDDVYANSDSNHVYNELLRLNEGESSIISHWQGPTETAIYLYGSSFDKMKSNISEFIDQYPLCQKCRVVKIT